MSQAGRNAANGTMNLRGIDLGNRAERAAQQAADESLIIGQGAKFAQARADSLAAHGLKPLDTGAVTSDLRAKLNNPSVGVDDVSRRAVQAVADKIEEWTQRNGGVIDANALYEIRKSAVNNTVEKLLGTADPKANARRAAGILAEVNPLIDKAIIDAGGTGWKDYLATHAAGMTQVDQQKMGAKALQLYDKSPKNFVDLVNGERPKDVQKVFGTGYDIKKEMGNQYLPLRQTADQTATDLGLKAQASQGSNALADILTANDWKLRLPWFGHGVASANAALAAVEGKVNVSTMKALSEGLKTGKSANALLEQLPTSERNKVLNALIQNNMLAPTAGAALTQR
jgi:hypothetical protein